MSTFALTVAYDGTEWAGFQRQPVRPTIQGALETALAEVLRHPVRLAAAGRTDAGVHALGQVISFASTQPIPAENLLRALNRQLPASIRIRRATERPAGFHARRSACFRRYWYVVQSTRWPDPIRGRFRWQLEQPLEMARMEAALSPLCGRLDYAAFCHSAVPPGGTVRTVQHARVFPRQDCLVIDIQADAFLHQMVRLIVANLVDIGLGERPVSWLEDLLQCGTRHLAGKGAPPCGLWLMRIGYPPVQEPPGTGG